MSRANVSYICNECSSHTLKWQGQCPACGAWNTLSATAPSQQKRGGYAGEIKGLKLADVEHAEVERSTTGILEFDRVLGGGLVTGSVVLIGGDPGIGKATLLLQRGETADCCRQLEQAQKLKVPAQAPPEKRRVEVLGLLEKQWRQAMAKAKELERSNRLGEAASAYEKILKDFPHDPWEKEIRQEIGRVWRRIQGPGGGL